MKKLVFFTVGFKSHILQLIPLLDRLSRNHLVFCVSDKRNKQLFQDSNCRFISYPEKYFENTHLSKKKILHEEITKNNNDLFDLLKNSSDNTDQNIIIESLQAYIYNVIKLDALKIYNHKESNYKFLNNVIDICKPDIIFKDTLELYTGQLSKDRGIECIEYITNNTYGFDYLNSSKRDLYSKFFNINSDYLLSDSFFDNFFEEIKKIYNKISSQLNIPALYPYPNYNLKEKNNLIFSIPDIHPSMNYNSKAQKFNFIHPHLNNFVLDEEVPDKVKDFIHKSNKKTAYISTGSFVNRNPNFYLSWIHTLIKQNYQVIVSSLSLDITTAILNNTELSNVYIDEYVPQKYILNNADLFITSGGTNSIFEAIYFKVPMIIEPLTHEQIMNGVFLNNIGIAITMVVKGLPQNTKNEALQKIKVNRKLMRKKMEDLKNEFWTDLELDKFIKKILG